MHVLVHTLSTYPSVKQHLRVSSHVVYNGTVVIVIFIISINFVITFIIVFGVTHWCFIGFFAVIVIHFNW